MIPKQARTKKDYKDLGRFVLSNHIRRAVTESKTTKPAEVTTVAAPGGGKEIIVVQPRKPQFTPANFFEKEFWKWIWNYIKNRFGPNHPYQSYPEGETGIYKLDKNGEETIITLAGDWATNTKESILVADRMQAHNPHFTIHLGDTYYVGDDAEIRANFLPIENSIWPRGSAGSFGILGNHEMYARGIAFFKTLLPSLGLRISGNKFTGQKAGFFCIENEHWRILGLDTGYHSIGKIPIIEMIKWFGPDCRFDDILVEWLKNIVKAGDPNDKRSLLILTHHQYISAFEKEYTKPAKQLAKSIGSKKSVLWLFGHEHKFSMYEKLEIQQEVTAYGRCIGHGGMPVEMDKHFIKKRSSAGFDKLVMVDTRHQGSDGDSALGFNGYAVVKLKGEQLVLEYHDVKKRLLFETWTAMPDGTMQGKITIEASDLEKEKDKNWEDAVK